jgi:hypothetical protein
MSRWLCKMVLPEWSNLFHGSNRRGGSLQLRVSIIAPKSVAYLHISCCMWPENLLKVTSFSHS